jgi:hypothetical protein
VLLSSVVYDQPSPITECRYVDGRQCVVTSFLVTCTGRSPEDVALLTDVDALINALKDDSANVRVAAAKALEGIGPDAKAAVPNLIQAGIRMLSRRCRSIREVGDDRGRHVNPRSRGLYY